MFDRKPTLIGVVHLAALPGAPRARDPMPTILARAIADARALERAGFDALVVENFGDSPFYPRRVPAETVAALAVAARAVREAVSVPVGVNCLRNDGVGAIAIAAAAGLQFVRVNVYVGAAISDQGILEGEAHEVARARARLCPDAKILADVGVKHATPLASRPIEEEARDAVARGGADGVIVTGARTGRAPSADRLRSLARALDGAAPILVGSGLDAENARELLAHAAGAIVGTSVKRGGVTAAAVDPARAKKLVSAARP